MIPWIVFGVLTLIGIIFVCVWVLSDNVFDRIRWILVIGAVVFKFQIWCIVAVFRTYVEIKEEKDSLTEAEEINLESIYTT